MMLYLSKRKLQRLSTANGIVKVCIALGQLIQPY